jgi:hypothetical protein
MQDARVEAGKGLDFLRAGGEVSADGEPFYRDGDFLI